MRDYQEQREAMVEIQLRKRGIKDERVLDAMGKIPRHDFVPEDMIKFAYNDEPLPIGKGQTISQPYIVAYMTEALQLKPQNRVLEIGTGSGYQAAVLAEIVAEVYTVEYVEELSLKAQEVLRSIGYDNIFFRVGDGNSGWQEHAPYDAIMVTAAPAKVPQKLQEQLGSRGRMIVPVGDTFQELVLVTREKKRFKSKKLLSVRFVPLVLPP